MILIVDNYDSFVFNVSRYFEEAGANALVVRNDAITVDDIAAMGAKALVFSPGPRGPRDAGVQ